VRSRAHLAALAAALVGGGDMFAGLPRPREPRRDPFSPEELAAGREKKAAAIAKRERKRGRYFLETLGAEEFRRSKERKP
jgi:hypothetical protein